ncbi:hypothetical protein B0T22DRAFT_175528 [Podospora appendiculata]|uniref:Uncharacterized protein n=1 Tax=Podospora appendiculata TaxID=314037 RepID=A0AAE0XBW1_9PEZI|nr:hypothetical protein B0T22DRAFT_175528 [Podospora appendiculata]
MVNRSKDVLPLPSVPKRLDISRCTLCATCLDLHHSGIGSDLAAREQRLGVTKSKKDDTQDHEQVCCWILVPHWRWKTDQETPLRSERAHFSATPYVPSDARAPNTANRPPFALREPCLYQLQSGGRPRCARNTTCHRSGNSLAASYYVSDQETGREPRAGIRDFKKLLDSYSIKTHTDPGCHDSSLRSVKVRSRIRKDKQSGTIPRDVSDRDHMAPFRPACPMIGQRGKGSGACKEAYRAGVSISCTVRSGDRVQPMIRH